MIRDAEERGVLKPGGAVVEGTAGNTGIGLALVGNARGYRTVIVMPETQSQEKIDMLRLCGAEVRLVPAKPYRDPGNYVRVSERVAGGTRRDRTERRDLGQPVGQPRQLSRPHRIDGPRDLAPDRGQCGWLRLRHRHRRHAGRCEPVAALLQQGRHHRARRSGRRGDVQPTYKTGELASEGSSITEGIGSGPHHRETSPRPHVDIPFRIPDSEALPAIFDLLSEEGLCLGGSSGINVAGAIRLARELGPRQDNRHSAVRRRATLPVEAL